MRRRLLLLAGVGVLLALGAVQGAQASVPRVIMAEDFGYIG